MKKQITQFFLLLLLSLLGRGTSNAYYFGLKSFDDTVRNIKNIEEQLGVYLPIVSFIFDPREHHNVLLKLEEIAEHLGTNRVYHISISPNMYSAKEVAEGAFDEQYLSFFKEIKEKNLKVIFRTMHEMNGGRYPRSSDPENFKKARIHVWNLSRISGLYQGDILFDFSVNHRDMTSKGIPSQTAELIQCKPGSTLEKQDICRIREDYYPGDEYVDLMGFTFYNRGKANSNRLWLTPEEILLDPERKTLERIQAKGKPIIIDEVGTTTVWYEGAYSFEKSREEYLYHSERKELWLNQLQTFISKNPEILAAIYFNVDYTKGLSFKAIGEADRAIADLSVGRVYQGFFNLYQNAEENLNRLLFYFGKNKIITIDNEETIIPENIEKEINLISQLISKRAESQEEKLKWIKKLQSAKFKDIAIIKSLEILEIKYRKEDNKKETGREEHREDNKE